MIAYVAYIASPGLPAWTVRNFRPIHAFLYNKWYFDELYDFIFVRPVRWLARELWIVGDGEIIDGLGPDGVAARAAGLARRAVRFQLATSINTPSSCLSAWWSSSPISPISCPRGAVQPMKDWPILTTIILLPFVGAVFLATLRGDDEAAVRNARWIALWTTLITLGVSLVLVVQFDPSNSGFQFVEHRPWLSSTISYYVGVDGLSLPFVILTTFLMPICILASWRAITVRVKEYMIAFLLLETLMIGVFCSLDLVLFYLFLRRRPDPDVPDYRGLGRRKRASTQASNSSSIRCSARC